MSTTTLPAAPLFRQRWFLIGLGLFFLAIAAQYYFKVHDDERQSRSAIKRWHAQIVKIDQRENIWAKYVYPNPPIMALILRPLAELSPNWNSIVWLVLKCLMAVLAIHWVVSLLDRGDRPFPLWAKALAVLLALRPIQGDLMHGNVNLFILFLLVGALYAFCKRRDVLAGLTLALAIACKVTPALFVPYFVWKRAWKLLAACTVGLGLFLWVVPALWFGWAKNHECLMSWYQNMIVPFVAKGEVTSEHQNQSLPGLAARLLTHEPSFIDFVDDVMVPIEYHNVANVDPGHVRLALKGVMALFALLIVFACRTPAPERGNWRLWAEFSLIVLGMLLFSERTWKHHCVTLLLPFAVACYALAHFWERRPLRVYLIATLALAALLMTLTSTGLFDEHDRFGKLAQVYGAYVWAYMLLAAGMVVILRQKEAAEKPEWEGGKALPVL
jgi:alpha-1,2-mannosyltransferase